MAKHDTRHPVVATWHTSHRVTSFLIENLPDEIWRRAIPGAPRRTIQMIGGHIHNCRCMWIKKLGERHGLATPRSVNRHKVARVQLLRALECSNRSMVRLLEFALARGGRLPGFSPPDLTHFMTYHAAHEGHHRGQIVMVARQLGLRLPGSATAGLWHWGKRGRKAGD